MPAAERKIISLDGVWQFQTNGASAWTKATLPANWEQHAPTNFDGIGSFRRDIGPFSVPARHRALLHFDAAATSAEVYWNDTKLGAHLGGWTPFRFDVTEYIQPQGTNEIRVRLDEKVGHNTQGFLPIVQPHFGGLWQSIRIEVVPAVYIDTLQVLAYGNPDTKEIEMELPIGGAPASTVKQVDVQWRERGGRKWTSVTFADPLSLSSTNVNAPTFQANGDRVVLSIPIKEPHHWSPASPKLYEVEMGLNGGGDKIRLTAAFRKIEAHGTRLLLNGQPLNVRGVLNWGYYPPVLAPAPSEDQMRRDLRFVRENGFNLMKFCLWIPPKRFLGLADEMGVLTWMEYPTWHPKFTPEHLEPLRTEFREFFHYDRNHPSVILRSLTCETGPSADLRVIQSLYDEAKKTIPGALVEDDSSWIAWNRVSDFYDDHPYGNNHTWVKTIAGLNDYVAKHTAKPLLLGEAIAADTWPDWNRLSKSVHDRRPYWLPRMFDDQKRWAAGLREKAGAEVFEKMEADSLRYGMLMRKFQAETFRREATNGGYVISVIRDFPSASMGLIDYFGKSKWSTGAWAWQRDTALLLQPQDDRRSAAAGEGFEASLLVSHFGPSSLSNAILSLSLDTLEGRRKTLWSSRVGIPALTPGTLTRAKQITIQMPVVLKPTRAVVRANLRSGKTVSENEWPIWLIPNSTHSQSAGGLWFHSSVSSTLATNLFPTAKPLSTKEFNGIVVASRFDESIAQWLEKGGKVFFLPDGRRNSLPLRQHWFLRGAPYMSQRALPSIVPPDMLIELQHFDLAGQVITTPPYSGEVDPMLMLWDTHDRTNVVSHALVFETAVGKGRLLVSALRHDISPAGIWLANVLLDHLRSDHAPSHSLQPQMWTRLKQQINAEELRLAEREWDFRPDRDSVGLRDGWQRAENSPAGWSKIKVGKHWESQGHQALDGWAWYRLKVAVPEQWRGRSVFLTFTGVDDLYELYINGELFSKRGDLATRQTTFSETFSHDLTRIAMPGEALNICVRVYDWFGAGGIFQPVYLSTTAHEPGGDILSRQ